MAYKRELISLPLAPGYKAKLATAGFSTIKDVIDTKPSELSKELEITKEEAMDILRQVKEEIDTVKKFQESGVTALDLLNDEQSQQFIITFSEKLDEMLGGGVPLAKITEFCGAPGTGKTQISMQLCVDVQIPETFGGLGGEAVYIDTEGSMIVDRLADIASAAVHHCQQLAVAQGIPVQQESSFTVEKILSGIHCYRCQDYVQLVSIIHLLPDFLKEHPKVRLVLIDSIAFHFRHDFEDYALRTRLLNGLAQSFIKMAIQHKLAVVLTNQMTTKINNDENRTSQLIPALGESWGHAATIRIILYWQNRQRMALLYKSPSKGEQTVPYQITTGGVRDIQRTAERPCVEEGQPLKRPRLDSE